MWRTVRLTVLTLTTGIALAGINVEFTRAQQQPIKRTDLLKTDLDEMKGSEIKLVIPDALRVGHEAHFAQVTGRFLSYLRDRGKLPAWERPNMVAKYTVTTVGTEMSRNVPVKVAPRLAPK